MHTLVFEPAGAGRDRGALFAQDGARGMDLALKADAFFVRADSGEAPNSVATQANSSRTSARP